VARKDLAKRGKNFKIFLLQSNSESCSVAANFPLSKDEKLADQEEIKKF
jgi:hypothetical protein